MDKLFEITFLDEAFEFLKGLDRKHYEKIIYNILLIFYDFLDLKFIKKRSKVPDNEIQKAIGQRTKYFEEKLLKNKKK